MEFRIWDNVNKTMYYNAERIDDSKWDFGRLHRNIHCTTMVSVGKTDKLGVLIYTFDLLKVGEDLIFYVDEIDDGAIKLRGVNSNIEEYLDNFDSKDIEVLGCVLELENIETE
ncbi:hypothetical protein [Staphylococcus phage PT94]